MWGSAINLPFFLKHFSVGLFSLLNEGDKLRSKNKFYNSQANGEDYLTTTKKP